MKDPIRKVEFIPRFSIFTKISKTIAFEIANNFDFSSIKNIITLKFITPKVKAKIKLFAGTSSNKIKFKKNTANAIVSLFVHAIGLVNFKLYANPVIKLYASSKKIALNLIDHVSACIELFAQIDSRIRLISTCNDSINLIARSISTIRFLESAKARLKLLSAILKNRFKFTSDASARVDLRLKSQESIDLKTESKATVFLQTKLLENELNFKTSASAIAYRPMKMQSIYDVRMEDLYYKTMEDIFYG